MNDIEIDKMEKKIKQLKFKLSYVKGKEREKVIKELEKIMFGELLDV